MLLVDLDSRNPDMHSNPHEGGPGLKVKSLTPVEESLCYPKTLSGVTPLISPGISNVSPLRESSAQSPPQHRPAAKLIPTIDAIQSACDTMPCFKMPTKTIPTSDLDLRIIHMQIPPQHKNIHKPPPQNQSHAPHLKIETKLIR